jgi:hypothetical protein
LLEKLKNSCSTEAEDDAAVSAGESSSTSESSSSGMNMTLIAAVDTLIMLYYFGVHRQFSKVGHLFRMSKISIMDRLSLYNDISACYRCAVFVTICIRISEPSKRRTRRLRSAPRT